MKEITAPQEDQDDKQIYTIYHMVEDYLKENYDLRNNTIALDIEYKKKKAKKWESVNADDLWLEMNKKGIKIGNNPLKSILKSNFVKKHNPIKQYFKNLPKWNKKIDYINIYANYATLINPEIELEEYLKHFKKWLVRSVKTVLYEDYFNKQAFILADNGLGQNIGKTSFLRNLVPKTLKNYIAEDLSNDKDSLILLCKNFLINMDELATLSRKEINHFKAYFTKTQINARLPYDSKNSILPRIASFMGSTNQTTFLRDETGSVRWLIFAIKSIDWSYRDNFNIDNLWAQAYALAIDPSFDETFTREDVIKNEERNKQYQVVTMEQELIYKFFKKPSEEEELTMPQHVEFMTATDIALYLKENTSLNKVPYEGNIGKAMKSLGFERKQEIKADKGYQAKGYYVIKKAL